MILADEFISQLDPDTTLAIMEAMRRITAHGITLVITAHELDVVTRYADHVLVLRAGEAVLDTPPPAARRRPGGGDRAVSPPATVPRSAVPAATPRRRRRLSAVLTPLVVLALLALLLLALRSFELLSATRLRLGLDNIRILLGDNPVNRQVLPTLAHAIWADDPDCLRRHAARLRRGAAAGVGGLHSRLASRSGGGGKARAGLHPHGAGAAVGADLPSWWRWGWGRGWCRELRLTSDPATSFLRPSTASTPR